MVFMMYDDILLFIRLVDAGSFSKLSNLSNISQPTISRRIANLEKEFKVELIIRTTNNFRLSTAGQFLYEKFKNHKIYLDETYHEVRNNFGLDIKGNLRVAMPVLLSKKIIAPYLGDFLEQHPQIDLLLSYRSSFVDVIQEGFDVAITLYAPTSKNFKTVLLKKFYVQLYATPEFIERNGSINTLNEAIKLSSVGFLDINGNCHDDFIAVNVNTGQSRHDIIPHPRIYVDNLINAYELACSGKMMITAWDHLVEDELADGRLIKILPDYYFREISTYLVLPSQMLTKTQQIFADFIIDCFAKVTD